MEFTGFYEHSTYKSMQFLLRISSISTTGGTSWVTLSLGIIKPAWDWITDIADWNASLFEHKWTTFSGSWSQLQKVFFISSSHYFQTLLFSFFPLCLQLYLKRKRGREYGERVWEKEREGERKRERERKSMLYPIEFICGITSIIFTFFLRVFFPLSRRYMILKTGFTLFMRYLGILCITMFQCCKETTEHKSKHLPFLSESSQRYSTYHTVTWKEFNSFVNC